MDERASVLHSWCVQSDWDAPTVVGGAGARLQLADGRSILDMSSLAECSNLGHQHPRLVAAIRAQAEELCFVTNAWGAAPRAELAERLLQLSGYESGRVFFTLGGADANEHAVTIARQASGKPRGIVIARDRSYHGATHLAMALSGDTRTRTQVDPDALGVSHVDPPYAYRCPYGSRDPKICGELAASAVGDRIDVLGADRVAAVIMEPDAGSNGIVAPDSFWPALHRVTTGRDVLLIADEVMSGFGRCGEWFAWQRHGEAARPDMMTLAKGLTGAALPLGAVVLSAKVAARIEHKMLYTGLTYCGHPLSCAAGLAALSAYEDERLIERSRRLGGQLFDELQRMQERHPVIGDVRGGHGLFAVVELVADRTTREPLARWPQTPAPLKALVDAAMAEGVSFATRGNLILLAPPLVIEERDLADALALLDRLLSRFSLLHDWRMPMAFRLTYATMYNPPEAMHEGFEAALARVEAGLGGKHALFINGADRDAAQYADRRSPIDRELHLGEFALADARDADSAMRAAHAAFPAWRAMPAAERIRLVRRVATIMEERVYDIGAALVLEVGKNRLEALAEAQETVDFFNCYADDFESHAGYVNELPNDPVDGVVSRNRSVMRPHGVWVVIAPFNFPLALAGGPVAAALVTGNTVVVKGASDTPWAARLLADCIRDAGLPPGVFNYLSGSGREIGDMLVKHPLTAGATFTGSVAVGKQLLQHMAGGAWPRPCIAEMGGKNPCIVTAHADLERAAAGILRSAYGMGGQKCSALSRLYVHEYVADALIERLRKQISAIHIGDPRQRENWLGPVVNATAYNNYALYSDALRAGGAKVISGGAQITHAPFSRGWYVEPMFVEAPLDHALWQHEMFLPVLMLHRYRDNDEAMRLANDTSMGLTAGFYGDAEEMAWFHENIEAGVTYANRPQGATTGAWPGYQPFGGWKGSGSTGKAIASFYYLAQYLREQSRTVVD